MAEYSKDLAVFEAVSGGSLTGYSAITGTSVTGQTEDLRKIIPVSSITLNNGFTQDNGVLSIDPSTAQASYISEVSGVIPTPTTDMQQGDRFIFSYDGAVIMQGFCTQVVDSHSDVMPEGATHYSKVVYNLVSLERNMLEVLVTFPDLPAESALTRLRRFLTVDASAVLSPDRLEILQEAKAAGSATLLALAREFSTTTGYPVRAVALTSTSDLRTVQVVELNTLPSSDLADASEWCVAIDFTNGYPSAMACATNDTRFAAAQQYIAIDPVNTGVFTTGRDSTGSGGLLSIGLQVPSVVDAFGQSVVIYRVSQTFGETYSAQIEVV